MDCGVFSIYAREGWPIKMLDVKQKLMLLAIEEEIAHLELQMLHVDDHAYLGIPKDQKSGLDHFESNVLKPALKQLSQEAKVEIKPDTVTSSDILARFQQETQPEEPTTTEPTSTSHKVIDLFKKTAKSIVNTVNPAGSDEPANPTAPNKGWLLHYEEATIYVFVRYFKISQAGTQPILAVCVRKAEDMQSVSYSSIPDSDWWRLWSTGSSTGKKTGFFAPHIKQLVDMIKQAVHGIPSAQIKTPQTNHSQPARGGRGWKP
jgi:hypothetical protein